MKTAEELEKIFGCTREELDKMVDPWEHGGVTAGRDHTPRKGTAESHGC